LSVSDICTMRASSDEVLRRRKPFFSRSFDCVVTNDESTWIFFETALTGTPSPRSRSYSAITIIHCGPDMPSALAQKYRNSSR
jgi:hypothetical protein